MLSIGKLCFIVGDIYFTHYMVNIFLYTYKWENNSVIKGKRIDTFKCEFFTNNVYSE